MAAISFSVAARWQSIALDRMDRGEYENEALLWSDRLLKILNLAGRRPTTHRRYHRHANAPAYLCIFFDFPDTFDPSRLVINQPASLSRLSSTCVLPTPFDCNGKERSA